MTWFIYGTHVPIGIINKIIWFGSWHCSIYITGIIWIQCLSHVDILNADFSFGSSQSLYRLDVPPVIYNILCRSPCTTRGTLFQLYKVPISVTVEYPLLNVQGAKRPCLLTLRRFSSDVQMTDLVCVDVAPLVTLYTAHIAAIMIIAA